MEKAFSFSVAMVEQELGVGIRSVTPEYVFNELQIRGYIPIEYDFVAMHIYPLYNIILFDTVAV